MAKQIFAFTVWCALALAADNPHRAQWRSVADRLVQTPPEKYAFNWGEGVQGIGLMKIYARTREPQYLEYMERWLGLYTPKDIRELLNIGENPRGKRTGYCGHWSPGTAALYLYQTTKRPEYLKLAEGILGFIRNGAERSSEGALGHWQGSHQLWVDTLYMACPLLAGMGRMQRKPELIDDAADQILVYAKHLQDRKTGLFYHMWDWQTGERSPSLWARGNGWVFMSIADTVEMMDRKHKSYAALQKIAREMAAGLKATQDDAGLWHTVLDDSSSYPESSATSMVIYALLKLVRLKVLPAEGNTEMARRAWRTVNERYVRDGIVTGVSAGTGPGGSENYKTRPVGTETWGVGAYLMAGHEIDHLR
jgi:unsaturated rhamnogalacturonyl hydrolase